MTASLRLAALPLVLALAAVGCAGPGQPGEDTAATQDSWQPADEATWNPTVTKFEGPIALGETVTVHARISPGRAFPVTVAELVPNQRMVWSSGMPLGLFKGERTFTIEPGADGAVTFSMREVFSGLLSPLIGRTIPDLQPEFEAFAAALKRKVEAA